MAKSSKSPRFWKWVLGLSVAAVVVGAPGLYFGGKYYLKERALGWRKQGMAAAAAHDNETAADLLARYLRRNPQDLDALEAFIQCREQAELPNGQHIAETIGALKMVLSIDPDRLDDRRHLLDLYVHIQRRPEAMDAANAILAKHPNDARTLGIMTALLTSMNQIREALTVARQWEAAAPGELPPQMAVVQARFHLGQAPADILKDVQAQVDAKPKDATRELLLGFTYVYAGDDKQAAFWLRAAGRDADPKSDLIPILVAQFDSLGIASEAIAALQDLVERGAGPETRHVLACRYWEQGQWDEALGLLADVNPADGQSNASLLALKCIALDNRGRKDEMVACRSALAQRKQAAAQAWVALLTRILDSAEGDNKKIIENCRQALLLQEDIYLEYYLGDAYARAGEQDLAIDAWRRASAVGPTWTMPATRLVEALLQKGNSDQALWVASNAARRSPTSAGAIISLARAWAVGLETGDATQADQLLKLVTAVQGKLPGEEDTLLIRIELLAKAGKTSDAIATARGALAAAPATASGAPAHPGPSEQFFVRLAGVSRRYKLGLEDETFARAEQLYHVTPALAYARAINRFLDGNAAGGLTLLNDLTQRAAGTSAAWKLAHARYLEVTGSPDARGAWQALGDEFPEDVDIQKQIGLARAVQGDWDIMSKAVDRLHAISRKSSVGEQGLEWRLAQGRLYVLAARNDNDYVQGSLLLSNLIKDYPAEAEPHVLLAKALVHMNRTDGAIEHLTLASKLEPTSVPITLELASLLVSGSGDFDRAQKELDRIAPQLRTADERRQAANLLAQAGAVDKAVQLMEKPSAGGDAEQNDLYMAMLYVRQGNTDKADVVARRLLQKPDLASVQFAAALFLLEGKRADADQALAVLDSLKLEPGLKEMILGGFHYQAGEPDQALAQYQAAVKQAPANAVTWRTLAAVQIALGKSDDAIATIKRGAQAVAGAATTNPAGTGGGAGGAATSAGALKAVAEQADLLREALDDPGLRGVALLLLRDPTAQTPLDMLKLVVDGRRANDASRLAAQLQQFIERHPDFLPAYLRLSQCYAEMNRTSDALAAAQHAMSVFPTSVDPARIAAQLAGASNRWADMRSAAESWKQRVGGGDPGADVALARALIGLGDFTQARNQLRPYLDAARAAPDQFAALLSTYAGAVVNLGQPHEAEDLLWPLAEKEARWRSVWMDTTLTFRDVNVAVSWLEELDKVIGTGSPTDRLGIAEAYDILGRRNHAPELIARATAMTQQIAKDAPTSLVAQLTAGTQAERAGDLTSAEMYYRKVLALDSRQWVANNNLAMAILRRGGDAKEAVKFAQTAAAVQPKSANIYDTLAAAQDKAGDAKSAVASMRTALALVPDNLPFQVRLAQYFMDAGDAAAAMAKIREIDQNGRSGEELDESSKKLLDDLHKRAQMHG